MFKKYSHLLAIVGSLLTGNVWAGCDIDTAWDKSYWPQRLLKVRFDMDSGFCQSKFPYKWIIFDVYKSDGSHITSRAILNSNKKNEVINFLVDPAQIVTIQMWLTTKELKRTIMIDEHEEFIQS